MLRHNRSGAATREKILQAASRVLAQQGFGGFTLQSVAEGAKIRYGNLTHHYATREILVEAMFEHLLERYRDRFAELTALAQERHATVRDIVTWLLDDAVSEETAPVFVQLWAMASAMPQFAGRLALLYDQAVEAFMEAFGVTSDAADTKQLRDALFLLGTVMEGSSCIYWTRDRSGEAFRNSIRDLAIDTLTSLVEAGLEKARAGAR